MDTERDFRGCIDELVGGKTDLDQKFDVVRSFLLGVKVLVKVGKLLLADFSDQNQASISGLV